MLWAVQVCRICAQIKETCVPIFEKGLDLKIRRCFSVNVSKDDLKPKQMCQDCSIKLTEFYSFVILYFESNYRFDSLIYESTQLSTQNCVEIDFSLVAVDQVGVKADTGVNETKPLLECQNTGMVQYKDVLSLDNIEVEARDFGEHNLLNEIVAKTNIDLQTLVPDEPNLINETYLDLGQDVQGNLLNKGKLEKDFADNYQYAQSYDNNSTSVQQNCSTNNNKINIISVETVKNNSKHKQNKISVKTICDAFKRQHDYQVQQQSPQLLNLKKANSGFTFSSKRYQCNLCEKSFARRQCLNEHIRKHGNIRPYICNVCEKSFVAQWDLTSHKRIHTNIFSCEHCGKCFSAPSKLQRHVRTHTGERPFVCTVGDCRWSFSDKRNLIGHQLTHTNIRKFICDICKRSYKTKNQLKDHIQAHSDSHIFKCEVCSKGYKWKTNLVHHLKKHLPFLKTNM